MKNPKTSILFAVITIVAITMSCTQAPAEKEVIVVPANPVVVAPAPSPAPSTVIIKEEPAKNSTTVTFDKNGVKIEADKVQLKVEKK